jgi:hypothetical protein
MGRGSVTPLCGYKEMTRQGWDSLNEDDCFPLLLSLRECSEIDAHIRAAASKAEVADILNRHDLSEDDFLAGFSGLAKAVQELPDESIPAA